MVVSREYNRLDDILEDDNEEESEKDGECFHRGDAAAADLIYLLVDKEVNYSSYEGESEEGITTSGRLVHEIEEAADLHVEGHTGKAALSLWRRALESVIPEDDKILYYHRDSTVGCIHATTEGAGSRELDNDDSIKFFHPQG